MTPSRQSSICKIIAQSLPSVSFPFCGQCHLWKGSSRLPKKGDWESRSKKNNKQCSLCLFSIPHPPLHSIICPFLHYFLFSFFIQFIPSSTCVSSSLYVVWAFYFVKLTQGRVIREEGLLTEKRPTSDLPNVEVYKNIFLIDNWCRRAQPTMG